MAQIDWLGHASFRITGEGKTLYIDPWKLKDAGPKADLVLISHSHYDHLNMEDLAKISKPGTQVICSHDCAAQIHNMQVRPAGPDETVHYGTIIIRTTPAYNLNKEFHPRKNDWLGFLIAIEGEVIYYAGDTDVIPEMSSLGKVDVALLPVGGTYTMTPAEAAEAVKMIKPARAIPYHWGDIVGSAGDAQKFKELSSVQVDILQPQHAHEERKQKAA